MKLLTINTHSHIEPDYDKKCDIFTDAILRHRPDIIAMQEVNQRIDAPYIGLGKGFDVKKDNHAIRITRMLYDSGVKYNCFWYGFKNSCDVYQEGIAVLSLKPAEKTHICRISRTDDLNNWKTRYALGVKIANEWFYSVHMGRYDDKYESYKKQFESVCENIDSTKKVWLMGDFNCPDTCDEYSNMINSGWFDTYTLASKKDSGVTVPGDIDGWRNEKINDMRIDYILTNYSSDIKSSEVIFNGENEDIISDHFGVIIDY